MKRKVACKKCSGIDINSHSTVEEKSNEKTDCEMCSGKGFDYEIVYGGCEMLPRF